MNQPAPLQIMVESIPTPTQEFPKPTVPVPVDEPKINPSENVWPLTLSLLMSELSVISDILTKRHHFSKVALELQPSGWHLTAFYKTDEGQEHRYISRKITDSLTPKGLAMVIGEMREGVGI